MKFKSFLKFLTGTIIIGSATVTVLNVLQKKSNVSCEQSEKNINTNAVNCLKSEEKHVEEQFENNNIKQTVGITIAARHEEASDVINEALSNIDNSEKENNTEAFEDLKSDLEALLK